MSDFFKSLSESTRLRIVYLLFYKKSLCVCDIENALKETQSKISRHLSYLVKNKVVRFYKKEQWRYYFIDEPVKRNPVILYIVNEIENDSINLCMRDVKELKEYLEFKKIKC